VEVTVHVALKPQTGDLVELVGDLAEVVAAASLVHVGEQLALELATLDTARVEHHVRRQLDDLEPPDVERSTVYDDVAIRTEGVSFSAAMKNWSAPVFSAISYASAANSCAASTRPS
jgi:hypothetical protein